MGIVELMEKADIAVYQATVEIAGYQDIQEVVKVATADLAGIVGNKELQLM